MLPYVLTVAAAAALGTAYLWAKMASIKNKRFAVLGPQASGKTTYIDFLLNGRITLDNPEGTPFPTYVKGKTVSFGDLEFKIVNMYDVPGTWDNAREWQKQVDEADVVCFLFDAKKFFDADRDYIKDTCSYAKHVQEWCIERKSKNADLKFFVVGTHLDQVAEYAHANSSGKTDFASRMWKNPNFERLVNNAGGGQADYFGCSLVNEIGLKQHFQNLFRKLADI
jgi:hypothetical protein